jgi:AcrR family transcriptional regulator
LASKPTLRKRAPRGQGAALRGEVLTAAMDLLRETGSEESVSVRAVASRVGVSVPAIYLHFADKQALLDAVCEEVFELLHVAMSDASADTSDPFQALRQQGIAYVTFAMANPEHYRIVMMGPASNHDPQDEIMTGAFGHVLAAVTACIGVGVLEGDPIQLAMQLWAGVHGLASLRIAKPKFPWPPLEQFFFESICATGVGLAATTRIPPDLPADEVVRRLNTLRD